METRRHFGTEVHDNICYLQIKHTDKCKEWTKGSLICCWYSSNLTIPEFYFEYILRIVNHLITSMIIYNLSPGIMNWALLCSMFPESRYSCGSSHYNPCPGGGDRFLQALHESGHFHHDQETTEVQTRSLLLPGSAGLWDLDVYCVCIYRCERGSLPGESFQSIRMAPGWEWRGEGSADGPRSTQRLRHL